MKGLKERFWLMLPWLLPEFLMARLPVSWLEQIERAAYDGMTMHEWVALHIGEMQAANARNAKRTTDASSTSGGSDG